MFYLSNTDTKTFQIEQKRKYLSAKLILREYLWESILNTSEEPNRNPFSIEGLSWQDDTTF